MNAEPSLATILISGIVTLASVVAYLYRRVSKEADDHSALRERVGRMEGRQEGIEDLARETLEAVRSAKQCRYPVQDDEEEPKKRA